MGSIAEPLHVDPFPEQIREEDAGAVFVLESKGDIQPPPTGLRISGLFQFRDKC